MMDRLTIFTGNDSMTDAIGGYAVGNEQVKLFEFGNIVVRKDYKEVNNVRLLSGGASGNEPAYPGLVGKGMLTAAVQGNLFQSPTSNEILRVIRELNWDHSAGVLAIVQGISKTTLNFGLAIERAIKEKMLVKMVIVSDDFNEQNYMNSKRRGMGGIMLIIKMAGAMAEAGHSLHEINAACVGAEKMLCSVSVGMKYLGANVEYCECQNYDGADEIEIGVGVNEEPGIRKLKLSNANDITETIVKECVSIFTGKFNIKGPYSIFIMLNNTGGLFKMEELIFIKQLILAFTKENISVMRLFNGHLFVSRTIVGVIVTAMAVYDERIIQLLDQPTNALGWRPANQSQLTPLTLDDIIIPGKLTKKEDNYVSHAKGPKISRKEADGFLVGIQFVCDSLISCERQLNLIDTEVGDGDTGTRLKLACELILEKIKDKSLVFDYPFTFFDTLSKLFEASVGGTLGCIYFLLFEAAANYFQKFTENDIVDCMMWLGALEAACEALKRYGGVEFGDHTMYDALEACARKIREGLEYDEENTNLFLEGVHAANYIALKKPPHCSYPDPGAHAVSIWLKALYEGVTLGTLQT